MDKTVDIQLDNSFSKPFTIACHKISDIAILDQKKNLIDINIVKIHLLNQGRLTIKQLDKILRDGEQILKSEPNLLEIDKKCYIFGDIHGQFYDLISILDKFDFENDTLLFLGDYVDRGLFSVETYLYLILLKSHYPNNIYLLRGNHESEKMTNYFTFKAECEYKYGDGIYELFLRSFNMLPMAALVQGKAFCAHGGISPLLKNLKIINTINRFEEVKYTGLFCDLLWSDPHEFYDLCIGKSWEANEKRRCSYKFNYEDVKNFLNLTNTSMIIRAHEVQEEGYKLFKAYRGYNSVVTIFSAPCYCDAYQNKGAYIDFDKEIQSIKQFEAVPHPFVISGFIDGINWSMPFVAEKTFEFCITLFKELESCPIIEEPEEFIQNMNMMRTERESIDEFEKEESLDSCILNTIEDNFEDFKESEELDKENETIKAEVNDNSKTLEISPSLAPEKVETPQNLEIRDLGEIALDNYKDGKSKKKSTWKCLCGLV